MLMLMLILILLLLLILIGSSTLTLQAACVVAMSQEMAAIGGAWTVDAAHTIVPTHCHLAKWVDYFNKRLPSIQEPLAQTSLERGYGERERDDDGHFLFKPVDVMHL